jgi:hypothetical protein
MLSCARVYVFDVEYQGSTWLTYKQTDQLSGLIAQMLSLGIKELTFKNLQFVNVYESKLGEDKYSSQLHINKITYEKAKIISKEQVADLRSRIRGQLKKILQLKFGDVLIINDEFEYRPTAGFLRG